MADSRSTEIVAQIADDGSVELEGISYQTVDALKPKVAEIIARTPAMRWHVKAPPDMPFKTMSNALLLLIRAGAPVSVGFVTSPRQQ